MEAAAWERSASCAGSHLEPDIINRDMQGQGATPPIPLGHAITDRDGLMGKEVESILEANHVYELI